MSADDRRCVSSLGACGADNTRLYLTGYRCPEHTPARLAGHAEPPTPDFPPIWWDRTPTPLLLKGATDINKDRTGGYKSRERARREAAYRDRERARRG